MRLNNKKNITVLDVGVDDEGFFCRVKKIHEYFDDNDAKSCYIVEFKRAIGFLNIGTILGALLGLIIGILIGQVAHSIIVLFLSLLFAVPVFLFAGSVYWQALCIGGESDWIIVPLDYKPWGLNGKRIITVYRNEPIPYLQMDGKYPKISMAALKLAGKKHLFANEIKHLKKSNAGILLIIIMVVVVLAGAVYMISNKNKQGQPFGPVPTANQTPVPTANQTWQGG